MAGQLWSTSSLGGYLFSPPLSKVLRFAVQPLVKYRQFADIKDAATQGKQKGDIMHWNRFSDVQTAGTVLNETDTVPVTNFVITQGTMTITEYANSVPYTGKLDDLSEQPVKEIISKVLKNDAKKALDTAAFKEFDKAPLRFVGTASGVGVLTTNGTATAANNSNLFAASVKVINDTMKERNIPPFVGDDYICIAKPSTLRPLKNDLEAIYRYVEPGFQMIINGEIGRYENTRFVEQTNIAATGTWSTHSASSDAFFFGQDTVAEGIAVPEEMRGAIPTDFGRSRGIAWYYLGGFGLTHPYSASDTASKDARILKWDSAA
jgi:N4-gp56 family major capsid protein